MNRSSEPTARIVLVGMPGSGKSTIATLLAHHLGWSAFDTDDHIVATNGRNIPRIFTEDGEESFRRLERQSVARAVQIDRAVISTGGGAILDPDNREALWRDALVVHLHAEPDVLYQRLGMDATAAGRPLVADEPLARLQSLWAQRAALYALADYTVRTDILDAEETTADIVRAWQRRGATLVRRPGRTGAAQDDAPLASAADADENFAARVEAPGGAYPVYAGWDILSRLPGWLRDQGLGPHVHIIADARVAGLYAEPLADALAEAGFAPRVHSLPLSEARKNLDSVAEVYERLVSERTERRHVVLALGGGVATDLGGFVAATYLRGLPLVQAPSSLLGMVDAAIGGKVAVNLREGKNLVGAFYQPRLVVADAALLRLLPRREFISGWAEVIKHALILDAELLEWLEQDADRLLDLDPEPVARVLRRSIAIKAAIVSTDEREDGLRMILNYGHTIGHALEAATGYEALLHGEAVAIGMRAAAAIGVRMGLIDERFADRQNALIARFGLPLQAPEADPERVRAAMKLDKKAIGGALRFILLEGPGRAVVRADVPGQVVDTALDEIMKN